MYVDEPVIFERDSEGLHGTETWPLDVPEQQLHPGLEGLTREEPMVLPRVSEVDVVRHFNRLSHMNHSIDRGFYPLGSCTMKYNPRLNEDIAALAGFAETHPLQDSIEIQGNLKALQALMELLAELTGMDCASLQPVAGAQGEFAGLLMIKQALTKRDGHPREVILVPDSAHGTNPATASMAGYRVEEIPSGEDGCLDIGALEERMGDDVAGMMITVPNTLGIFEKNIHQICEIVHKGGGLIYVDGANMNALMGTTRPGDWGADVMHLNLHKTFSTPHGGGGPGAGAITFKAHLEPYQPAPVLTDTGDKLHWDMVRPDSIGRLHGFHGNFGILVRALSYGLTLGGPGLTEATRVAVLNNNYLRHHLQDLLAIPFKAHTLHETVYSDKDLPNEVNTMDVAKRMIDFGMHPMTVYFPLVAKGAMMIEPTETEPQQELDRFVEAIRTILEEADKDPEKVKTAPHTAYRRRLDETTAARKPVLTWKPAE